MAAVQGTSVPSAAPKAQPTTPADPASNAKTQLNNFLQRHLRAMITKADVTYSVQQFGMQYQATVTLHSLNNMQFAGAIANSAKEAEQNSAQIALEHHKEQVAAQNAEPQKKSKKKSSEGSGPPPNQKGVNKMILNSALSRILRRPLTKEDITFTSRPVPGGWQATLTMPGLPGHWAGLAWAGEVDNSQKEAEGHAASHALKAMQADELLGAAMTSTKKKQDALSEAVPPGVLKGHDGAVGTDGGKSAGAEGAAVVAKKKNVEKKKREPVGDLPRTVLSESVRTGVIDTWRPFGFGWIVMEEKIEHEAAAKNRGRVYLNKKDWQHEEPPEKGQAVAFSLYFDDAGLGAQSCRLAA